MTWPTPQDYNEAVQNPRHAFADPELASGFPELTPLGLPRPVTGNFASVYRMRCNGKDWAVRCFWREYADLQERYAAISRHLGRADLSYMVGFAYLPQGIRVRGRWYPVLKMEWVDGALLTEYVRDKLQDRGALRRVAERWRAMMVDLRAAGIAHGDLQHGNVLVVGDRLKLVDYDGMFVPSLVDKTSHELGHQNYQHPRRSAADFGASLDHFSAWVVYLSLLGLAADSSLWTTCRGGDEALLFRKEDFESPHSSAVFAALAQCSDPAVRRLAVRFRASLACQPLSLPGLAEAADHASAGDGGRVRLLRGLAWARPGAMIPGEGEPVLGAGAGPPEWVRASLNEISGANAPRFTGSVRPLRWLVGLGTLAFLALPISERLRLGMTLQLLGGEASAACLCLLALLICYIREPAARTKWRLIVSRWKRLLGLVILRLRLSERLSAQARLLARREREERQTAARRAAMVERVERKRQAVEQTYEDAWSSLESWRVQIEGALQQSQRETLESIQQRHHELVLRERSIWTAPIPDLRWPTRLKLWVWGIRCAADVDKEHVEAMRRTDGVQASALIGWRAALQAQAKRSRPRKLPPELLHAIDARYEPRQWRLRRAIERVEGRREALLGAIAEVQSDAETFLDARAERRASSWLERQGRIGLAVAQIREQEILLRRGIEGIEQRLSVYGEIGLARYLLRIAGDASA